MNATQTPAKLSLHRAIACSFIAILAAGCSTTPVSLKLAPELAGVVPTTVSGREAIFRPGTLAFDRWSATAAQRSSNGGSLPVGTVLTTSANEEAGVDVQREAFEFDVSTAEIAPGTHAQCVARGRFARHVAHHGSTTDETSVTVAGYPRVDCAFSGAQAGELVLRPTFISQRDSGSAHFGERRWIVQSVNNLETQSTKFPLARFGYEFSSGGRVVAAVETWGSGRVWMDPKLAASEKDELSVVIAALLYYGSLLDADELS